MQNATFLEVMRKMQSGLLEAPILRSKDYLETLNLTSLKITTPRSILFVRTFRNTPRTEPGLRNYGAQVKIGHEHSRKKFLI